MEKRRSFIKKSSLALAATALPLNYIACMGNTKQKAVPQENKEPVKKLGVALLGLGNYATNLLAPALRQTEHIELRGIVTGSPEKIPQWQEKYGIKDENVYNYETLPDIANNPEIDVVYIVVPTFLHMKYSVMAANAGKHVFCEKPMAMDVAECQAIIEACNKNKVKLAIGYRMQHEKNTKTIMQWADSKPYGKIQSVQTEAGFKIGAGGGWRLDGAKGGGAIYDMGVYPINATRYSTGLEPIAVTARHETKRPGLFINGAPEITYFDLEFPKGITAKGRVTYNDNINYLKVDCEDGGYELSPFQSYNGVQGKTSDGKTLAPCDCYQQAIQMDDDAQAIIKGTAMLCPGEEGLNDIKVVRAIFESAAHGSKKVMV
ncbi:MAG: glucose-fructose oxidoreductase [Cytophagaceae bacterium]|nr:glucose-fructose oxidoreductase [Cytophagaceae bacterium]